MPAKKQNDLTLDKILSRLDEITLSLDSDIELEKALELYEEGVTLIKEANKKISSAEKKIKVLNTAASGDNDDE